MRVSSISSAFNYSINQSKNYVSKSQSFKGDDFERELTNDEYRQIIKYSVEWGGWKPSHYWLDSGVAHFPIQKKLNILNGSEEHLNDISESLCMYPDEDIKNFSAIFTPFRLDVDEKKSDAAYKKLRPFVDNQRERLLKLMRMRDDLSAKNSVLGLTEMEADTLKLVNEEIKRINLKCIKAVGQYTVSQYNEMSDEAPDAGIYY